MIWAIVKFQFEGLHYYSAAPRVVDFLRNPHRHLFFCEVWVQESKVDNNREVEYITLKRELLSNIDLFHNNEEDSCEMIAQNIRHWLSLSFPNKKTKCFVFEDNENGAMIE